MRCLGHPLSHHLLPRATIYIVWGYGCPFQVQGCFGNHLHIYYRPSDKQWWGIHYNCQTCSLPWSCAHGCNLPNLPLSLNPNLVTTFTPIWPYQFFTPWVTFECPLSWCWKSYWREWYSTCLFRMRELREEFTAGCSHCHHQRINDLNKWAPLQGLGSTRKSALMSRQSSA